MAHELLAVGDGLHGSLLQVGPADPAAQTQDAGRHFYSAHRRRAQRAQLALRAESPAQPNATFSVD